MYAVGVHFPPGWRALHQTRHGQASRHRRWRTAAGPRARRDEL